MRWERLIKVRATRNSTASLLVRACPPTKASTLGRANADRGVLGFTKTLPFILLGRAPP